MYIDIYIYKLYTCETPIKVYGQVHYLAKLEKFSSYSLSSSAVINMWLTFLQGNNFAGNRHDHQRQGGLQKSQFFVIAK